MAGFYEISWFKFNLTEPYIFQFTTQQFRDYFPTHKSRGSLMGRRANRPNASKMNINECGIQKSGFESCTWKPQGQTPKPWGFGEICKKPQKEDPLLRVWWVLTGAVQGDCQMTAFQSEFQVKKIRIDWECQKTPHKPNFSFQTCLVLEK